MTRFYGRAKGKKRVYDYVPAKRIKRTTLLSSVRLDGTIVKKVFQGALNGKIFLDYIKNTGSATKKLKYIKRYVIIKEK